MDAEEQAAPASDLTHHPSSKKRRRRHVVLAILSGAMLIGAFVPIVVDLAQDGELTWSLYAVGALVMAWLVLAPWFRLEGPRATTSWIAAVLTVPSYLLLVHSLGSAKGWLLPLGLPEAALGLAGWGSIVWLWSIRRVDRWYLAAATILVAGLVGLFGCMLARPFMVEDSHFPARRAAILSIIGASVVMGLGRFLLRGLSIRLRASQDEPKPTRCVIPPTQEVSLRSRRQKVSPR
jgi:hypothetical protein